MNSQIIREYAPLYIPTLCRYEHFKQCIESLARCAGADQTEVYVALDYPANESHRAGYEKIKNYLDAAGDMGFKKLHVHKRDHNYGVSGATSNSAVMCKYISERYDRYIVSEDDNVFAPSFLLYVNTCLEKYKDDPDVVTVCGYSYPVEWEVSAGATCFKQQINCSMWGVAFWTKKIMATRKELWGGIIKASLPQVMKQHTYKRMIDACLKEYVLCVTSPLKRRSRFFYGVSDIGMRAYLAVEGKYAVTPVVSKVRNLGFDGSGVYCQITESEHGGNTAGTYNYSKQPIDASDTFELVEDTLGHAEENQAKLNAFDYRSPKEMAHTHRVIWLCEHVGIGAAKLFALLESFGFCVGYVWKKLRKKWAK